MYIHVHCSHLDTIFLATYVVPTKDYIIPRIPAQRTSLPALFSVQFVGTERVTHAILNRNENRQIRTKFENQLISAAKG